MSSSLFDGLGRESRNRKPRNSTRDATTVSSRRSRQPRFESLEDRNLLTAFWVTNLDDSGQGSLRQAVTDANENPGGDTVIFSRAVDGTIVLSSQIMITDDVTIRGPGAQKVTVSGSDSNRVFAVLPEELTETPLVTPSLDQVAASPSVTIKSLAISDGRATDAPGFDPTVPTNPGFAFGGGLYNLGGTVHLDRVHMTSNDAVGIVTAGGAIANEFGGTLTVTRSHFVDNTSEGALIAVGGAITSDLGPTVDGVTGQPTVIVDRSSFIGNIAESQSGYMDGIGFSGLGGGGAILNVTGLMTINRSHFENNAAVGGTGAAGSTTGGPAFGGAVLSGDASPFGIDESELHISRSTFLGNTALGGGGDADIPGGQAAGGAVAANNGTNAELHRNRFRENAAIGGSGGQDAPGGTSTGGGVAGAGGAILNLVRNAFDGNTSDGGDGSGTGADAAGRGGGLGLDAVELAGFFPGSSTATVVADKYTGNVAFGGIGGGIYNEGELSIKYSVLSENQAVGQAEVEIDFVPGYSFQGAALGGGLSNLGTLYVHGTTFSDNQAIGADGGTGPNVLTLPPNTAAPTYPGLAVGGGLHNITEAEVTHSRFIANEALAGSNNVGSFAGVANGGGIYSDGALAVTGSSIVRNRAAGGGNNTGDINTGGGYGGGVTSGSVAALTEEGRNASLFIEHSTVRRNEAVGGDGNQGLFPVPQAQAAGSGTAGGILVYQGSADISKSSITRNRAIGGEGGLGSGGGVFFFGFVGSQDARLSNSLVAHNAAIGGLDGNGIGGGIASGSLGSIFGGPVDLGIHRTMIFDNLAEGGDALGGGIFNDSDAILELSRSLVFRNRAIGDSDGDGIGGGLYNLGTTERIRSLIFANFASTSDDDCFGC